MKYFLNIGTLLFIVCFTPVAFATEDRLILDTTVIKGNTELPKILYVVPWKSIDNTSHKQQKIILHSLFGDLFDPVAPAPPASNTKHFN